MSTKMKKNNKYCYSFPYIIYEDLLRYGKLPLFLLICIIVTAISIITVTYYTRLLIIKREQLVLESNILEIEWRNLILEENVLGNHDRIEQIAVEQLKMQYINPYKENFIVKKNIER